MRFAIDRLLRREAKVEAPQETPPTAESPAATPPAPFDPREDYDWSDYGFWDGR